MEKRNEIHAIFGRKGSGKSDYMRKLSGELDRVIIFDVTNDYSGGFEYNDVDLFIDSLDQFENREKFRIVLKFDKEMDDYEKAIYYIWNSNLTHYWLVVDEVHNFAASTSITKEFKNCFALGRHANLSILCASQRPYAVHPIVRSQADIVTTFFQDEPRDLILLREFGFDENEVRNLDYNNFEILQIDKRDRTKTVVKQSLKR